MDAQKLTIKEYAESRQVSYETARRWVSESEGALEGHIIKEHGKRCLDDVAQSILDMKNIGSQLQAMEEDTLAGVEKLKRENEDLKNYIADLQSRLLSAQDKLLQEKERSESLRIELEQVKALEVRYTEQNQPEEDSEEIPESDLKKDSNEPTDDMISEKPAEESEPVKDLTEEEPEEPEPEEPKTEMVKASSSEIDVESLKADIMAGVTAAIEEARRQAAEETRKAMEVERQAEQNKKPLWKRILGL